MRAPKFGGVPVPGSAMPSCGRRPEGLSKKAHQLIQINGPQDPKRSACFPENCVATPVRRRIFFIDGKGI
jgi:hypothetical protein